MPSALRSLLLLLAVGPLALALQAQTVPTPEPADASCLPFACRLVGDRVTLRYQQLYSAVAFSVGPVRIDALTFFAADPLAPPRVLRGSYIIRLSTTSRVPRALGGTQPPNALTGTDLDENIGSDVATFAAFVVTDLRPVDPTFTITADTPFLYDPSRGNLLLEVLADWDELLERPTVVTANFAGDFGTSSSQAFCARGTECNVGDAVARGITTRFTTVPVAAVPEPSTWGFMATGLAALATVTRRRRRAS
jgi:hypothetical protein